MAENLSDYFRVPLDSRDMNYSVYFEEWEEGPVELESYTSRSTEHLSVSAAKKLLLIVPELRQKMGL